MNLALIVGTRNETKLQAVLEAVGRLKHIVDGPVDIVPFHVETIAQPFNEQVVASAMHRARVALGHASTLKRETTPDTTLGIGIEGGIVELYDTSYITAYCHAEAASGEHHGAWTAFIECPLAILAKLEAGGELGPVVDILRAEKGLTWRGGAFGTLTSELYTRKAALVDALVLCLVPFFIRLG